MSDLHKAAEALIGHWEAGEFQNCTGYMAGHIGTLRQALAESEQEPYASQAAMVTHIADRIRIDPETGNVSIGTPAQALDKPEIEPQALVEMAVLAEREACAKVCDEILEDYETRTDLNQTQKQVGQLAAEVCGVRIRERVEE